MKRTAELTLGNRVFSVVRFTDYGPNCAYTPALKRWAIFIAVQFADVENEFFSKAALQRWVDLRFDADD